MFYTAWSVEDHACFPVPEDGRFGMPLDQSCLYATVERAVSCR